MNTEPGASRRTYMSVFVALMLLLLATIAAAYVDLHGFNTVAALTIAVAKALLVVLFFMHVRYSSRLTWVFAAAGFFWLMLLLLFTFSDFLTRGLV